MFKSAAPGRQKTSESFAAAMQDWRGTSDNWFDGSVHSVDRRLSRCAKLIDVASKAVGSGETKYLASIQELSADRTAIASLREDLLTGDSGREPVGVSRSPGRTAALATKLSSIEQRWVDLESARFINSNRDVAHVADELAERAWRHADRHPVSRTAAAAFIDRVVELGRQIPQPRVASVTTVPDFDASLMYF